MIFAKVNVDLPTHERFLRIPRGTLRGAALGVWTAATCWTRDREQDGFCPLEHLEQFGGPKVVDSLVDVGLFELGAKDGVPGAFVLKYADHNETKQAIQARREATRERVAEHRRNSPRNAVTAAVTSPVPIAVVPGSDSVSDLRSREGIQGEASLPTPDDIPITEAIRASCAMAGARAPTGEDVVACLANARKKGHIRVDWASELVSWMVRGKRYDARGPAAATAPSRSPASNPIEPLQRPGKQASHG